MSKIIPAGSADLTALLDTGLIYAANQLIFHPLGFAIALSYEDEDKECRDPKFIVMHTDDGSTIAFDDATLQEGRTKLKAFLDARVAANMPPDNDPLLNTAVNAKAPETVESLFLPSEQRFPYDGEVEVYPPLLVRGEDGEAYMPYDRTDLILAMGGRDRKRVGAIVGYLNMAWRMKHETGDEPDTVALPSWLHKVWSIAIDYEKGPKFVGRKFVVGKYEDRIYLVSEEG